MPGFAAGDVQPFAVRHGKERESRTALTPQRAALL